MASLIMKTFIRFNTILNNFLFIHLHFWGVIKTFSTKEITSIIKGLNKTRMGLIKFQLNY